MRLFSSIVLCAALLGNFPGTGAAGTVLYKGTMDILTVSGKGCAGVAGRHPLSLVLSREDGDGEVSGFFEGEGVTLGRFSGRDLKDLQVRYPLHEEARASGHLLSLTRLSEGLSGELRDKHLEANAEDCNFDLARLDLTNKDDGPGAGEASERLSISFDAQLLRSEALALAHAGRHAESLPLYRKALERAEKIRGDKDPDRLVPYLTGLAGAYVKLGQFDLFHRFYEERIGAITNPGARAIFDGYRFRALLMNGKSALLREEFPAALDDFMKARTLYPESKEAVAAIMMVYMRTEEFGKAIAFLEDVQKSEASLNLRQEVQTALAHLYFLRGRNLDRKGDLAAAERDLKRAEELEPQAVGYLIALARLRHKTGTLADAEKMLSTGLERFQRESDRQQLAAALERMRQTEQILGKLRKAGS